MSSSEDEGIVQPVKCVRRRKRINVNEFTFNEVNLFSRKVMPTIKVNQSILNKMEKEMTATSVPNEKPSIINLNDNDNESVDCSVLDEDVQIISETSSVEPLSLTPPPEAPKRLSSIQDSIQRKRNKLLCNVASVVLNAKQDVQLNTSVDNDFPTFETFNSIDDFTMVKIRFHSHVYKYSHSKKSPFKEIFDKLSKDTMSDKNHLLLTLKDQQVSYDDTPESIGLSIVDFIDAVVMDDEVLRNSGTEALNINCINIHFQCKFQKAKKTYSVNKHSPLIDVMRQYASAIDYDVKKLRFLFDGEVVDGSLTAQDLEIENDYCLDVMRSNAKKK